MSPAIFSLAPAFLPAMPVLPHRRSCSSFPIRIPSPRNRFLVSSPSSLRPAADRSPSHLEENAGSKPSPAEISRTIMELAATGTLSAAGAVDGWPLGVGARFVVSGGAPVLCLNWIEGFLDPNGRSSFHVQFDQNGTRTPQCTLLGSLYKPVDDPLLKKLCAKWENKFGEDVDRNLLYMISVERVLYMEDFKEAGLWVDGATYVDAVPDPLRNCAEKIVVEMNSRHAEDIQRMAKIYVEENFKVTDAKMIWVDRLGFDLYIHSDDGCVYSARVPFPREVADEKSAKSSFNFMSHLAWEVEKGFAEQEFSRTRPLKIR